MPALSTKVPHDTFWAKSLRHEQLILAMPSIDPKLQKMLAELIMMRLFDDFQEALAGIASRLACGAPYSDGTLPTLLVSPARSLSGARSLFVNEGRLKPQQPKWSKFSYISDSTKYVIDRADPFLVACSASSTLIAEMQVIRNRIAHNNSRSRASYGLIVQRYYGSILNPVTPGVLLLSTRYNPQRLRFYLQLCRTIVKLGTLS